MSGSSVDLSTCEREPIHLLGQVQSHGVMLSLRASSLEILQISANAAALIGRPAEQLAGQPLGAILPEDKLAALSNAIAVETLDANPIYLWTLQFDPAGSYFDGLLHRHNGVLILELEPTTGPAAPRLDMARRVRNAISRLQRVESFAEFCDAAAREVRAFTGYDRVMLYQFDNDGHGQVVAEARRDELPPYLGLHYPASDIPRQARALYVLNWLRLIADVHDQPAPLVPQLNPDSGAVLDMSFAALRSVSPIHIEYLKNMGVGASMSLSLVCEGQLWGLLACHHNTPRWLDIEIRAACEFFAQAASLQIEARQRRDQQDHSQLITAVVPRLLEEMSATETWAEGLLNDKQALLEFMRAGGAAICTADGCSAVGMAPPPGALEQLIDWLITKPDELYATDYLSAEFPAFAAYADKASGLLALPVSRENRNYVLWFRPEVPREVNWAGEPTKPVEVSEQGMRISPRRSFVAWKEMLRGHSEPWQRHEIMAARLLLRSIVDVVVRRSELLAELNAELARSNVELDAFAYITSHDLREPLRGIANYAAFLLEDYGDRIDEAGQAQVRTMIRLSRRMDTLLESLLQFSRVGRLDLDLQPVALSQVLDDALDLLRLRIADEDVQIHVLGELPVVRCDRVRVGEVFTNLLSNGIKYNTSLPKLIEVGVLGPEELNPAARPPGERPLRGPVIFVRDNGIGIPERFHESIFRIFKRLHGRDEFGGGSGAGLTITRKVIERHGGTLWLNSEPGVGSTFYFTLQG